MVDYTNLVNKDIQFKDISTNNPTSWSWNFGDGSISSIKNPVHKYTAIGNYTISLVASNTCGSCQTKTKTISIVESLPAEGGNVLWIVGIVGVVGVAAYLLAKNRKKIKEK